MRTIPHRYWWLKRVLFAGGCLLVLLTGLWLWWGYYAHSTLQAEIDRIVAAGEPLYPADFDSEGMPDERNAALLIIEAAKCCLLPEEEMDSAYEFTDDITDDAPLPDEDMNKVVRLLEMNTGAFELLRRARELRRADWNQRIQSPAIEWNLYSEVEPQNLAKLLRVKALYEGECGDPLEAVRTLRDTLALADSVDQMPSLGVHMARNVFDLRVTGVIQDILPHLSLKKDGDYEKVSIEDYRQELAGLLADLLEVEVTQQAFVCGLYAERMAVYDMALWIIEGREFPAELANRMTDDWEQMPSIFARPILELAAANTIRFTNTYIAITSRNRWSFVDQKLVEPLPFDLLLKDTHVWNTVEHFERVLMIPLERVFEYQYRSIAERRMAAIAIAIVLYAGDHGRLPETLADLVVQYLPAIPEDPFAWAGQIKYRPGGERPYLYSVGPNGVDEDGAYTPYKRRYLRSEETDVPFFLDGGRASPTKPATTGRVAPSMESP